MMLEKRRLHRQTPRALIIAPLAPLAEPPQLNVVPGVEVLQSQLVQYLPRGFLRHRVDEAAHWVMRMVHHARMVGVLLFQLVGLPQVPEVALLGHGVVLTDDPAPGDVSPSVIGGEVHAAVAEPQKVPMVSVRGLRGWCYARELVEVEDGDGVVLWLWVCRVRV